MNGMNTVTETRMKCRVCLQDGRAALTVNGQVIPAYAFYMPYPQEEDIRAFADRGVHVFTWGYSDIIPHSMDMGWTGPGQFDYARLDREARAILDADPDALLLPRIAVSAPDWWLEKHPDENIVYADQENRSGHTAMASTLWRAEAGDALRRMIEHAEGAEYGERIIGYQLTGGRNEWFHTFGSRLADFSPAATAAWRQWLRDAYGNDVKSLREAWGNDDVDFETASVPAERERLDTPRGLLHDPAVSCRAPDYWRFFAETNADALLHFCRIAKDVTDRRKLTGAFYGYILNNMGSLADGRIPLTTGHLALGKVLNSPWIDFIAAPYQMTYRFEGGYGGEQTLPASIRLHGKLFFAEVTRGPYPAGESRDDGKTVEDGLGVIKRNFARRLIERSGMWWMEWNGGDFQPQAVRELLAKCTPLMRQACERPAQPACEIAVVVDEATPFWTRPGWEIHYPSLFLQERCGLARIGAPFETYRLDDLALEQFPARKLYVFLNCSRITTVQRRAVHERLKSDGAVALWVHAPGAIDENACLAENVAKTIGMTVTDFVTAGGPLGGPVTVYLTRFDHPVTEGLAPGTTYGSAGTFSPVFGCVDEDAVPLGRMFGTHGTEPVALALKEQEGWTSIFSAAPDLPAAMLRNLARMAGCHIYSDEDDIVCANERYLSVHVKRGGEKTFRLPRTCTVTDVFADRVVARNSAEFTDTISNAGTRLYEMTGPEEESNA